MGNNENLYRCKLYYIIAFWKKWHQELLSIYQLIKVFRATFKSNSMPLYVRINILITVFLTIVNFSLLAMDYLHSNLSTMKLHPLYRALCLDYLSMGF